MSTLFVCKGNVGRSQMAEALYKKTYDKECFSAGTVVGENEGVKIKDISMAHNVIDVLIAEEGIDISENKRKQITEDMCKKADKIVIMAEKNTWPEYLEQYKTIYRDIDNPKGMDYEGHKKVLKKIKKYIIDLE